MNSFPTLASVGVKPGHVWSEKKVFNSQKWLAKNWKIPMYHKAYGVLRQSEEAEDVVQEFLGRKFPTDVKKFCGGAFCYFRNWVMDCVKKDALDAYRERARRKEDPSGVSLKDDREVAADPPDDEPTPDAVVSGNDHSRTMHDAIDQLSPKYRDPLWLRAVDDKSYEEISKELKLSLGTVKTRIRLGRGLLTKALKRRSIYHETENENYP